MIIGQLFWACIATLARHPDAFQLKPHLELVHLERAFHLIERKCLSPFKVVLKGCIAMVPRILLIFDIWVLLDDQICKLDRRW